jgi:hypothetical protein
MHVGGDPKWITDELGCVEGIRGKGLAMSWVGPLHRQYHRFVSYTPLL